jgi:hypothetical protein
MEELGGRGGIASTHFTTSALDGGEWSASRPGRALPPAPIVQEAGWAPEPVWTQRLQEKLFRLCRRSNLDRPVVQSVVRHYNDWATPASLPHIRAIKSRAMKWERHVECMGETRNALRDLAGKPRCKWENNSTGGGLLWRQKSRRISWPDERLLACQMGFCSIYLITTRVWNITN